MPSEFETYLQAIPNPTHRERVRAVLTWVQTTFPQLVPRFAWNQPMFTDHGTFIIGFSVATGHLAFALEAPTMAAFVDRLTADGYHPSKKLGRILWEAPVDYDLLQEIIAYNVALKTDCATFWGR